MVTISGQEIREQAEIREETAKPVMKDSFYYGFREGAKWAQRELIERNKNV